MIPGALRLGPLVLASRSPQRRAILTQLGIPFEVREPDYEERDPPGAGPVVVAAAHAAGKARSVEAAAGGRPVLGVDTVVEIDGASLGAPADAAAAGAFLGRLSGRTHHVHSAICLLAAGTAIESVDTTEVSFRELDSDDLDWYLETGEWRGRAGGYAIQGRGAALVAAVHGDYTNVVGLSVPALLRVMARAVR